MTLICRVAGVSYDIQRDTFRLPTRLDEHDQCSFTLIDRTGTATFLKGTRVTVEDTVLGAFGTFVIHTAKRLNVIPRPVVFWEITCVDLGVFAANARTLTASYSSQPAGAIAVDVWRRALAAEGVLCRAAERFDTSVADWGAGTLSGVAATANVGDGNLELAKAGTDLIAQLPGFLPPAELALKLVGTAAQGFNNAFHYRKIWSGSLTVNAGDTLQYEVWISSTSPEIKAGVDLLFSDGSSYRDNDNGNTDYQNLPPHPQTDLSGLANDQWYFRSIGFSGPLIGKTVVACLVALEGDSQGTYTAYFRRIRHMNGVTVRQTYFDNQAAPQTNIQVLNNGYHDTSLSVVSAFSKPASQTDTISLSSVALVRTSRIAWSSGTVLGNVVIAPPAAPSFGVSAQDTGWTSGGIGLVAQANGGLLFDQFLATNGGATTYGQDTFTRTNTANGTWGTATDAQVWRHVAGSASQFQVLSNKGKVTNTPSAWDRFLLGTNTMITGDLEIAVRCVVDTVSSGFGVWLRADPVGQSGYFVMYDGLNASKGLTIYKIERGGITQLANAGFAVTVSSAYWVKAKITAGGLISGKIWLDGTAEPNYDTSNPGGGASATSSPSLTTSEETLTVETSIDDGASWQIASAQQPIPNLQAGMNVSGRNLLVRRTISAGKYADQSNHFARAQVQVLSSYAASKTDVLQEFISQSAWNTGTFSSLISPSSGGLTLNGVANNFDTAPLGGVTEFGSNPDAFIKVKQLVLRADNNADARARFDTFGFWTNFVAEVDIKVQASADLGIEYRTTNWNSTLNSYAYEIALETNQVRFNRGGNGSASLTSQTAAVSIASDSWHHLKIVVNGSNHSAYVDDTLINTWTDSTWSGSGMIALRYHQATGTSPNYGYFDNFGVAAALSGTWISPAISLASASNYGNSVIAWDTSGIINGTSATIEASLDNGATWKPVTNGGPVPGLTTGQSLSGVSLKLRVTLSAQSASFQPILKGLSVWVQGAYSASGSRISPALACAPVGGPARAAQIAWNGNQPAGTTITVDSSLDGVSFTQVGAGDSGSATIAGLPLQPDPTLDSFDVDSSASYTSTARTGGTPATWTQDPANSRISVAGGVSPLLLRTGLSATDVDLLLDLDQAESGGLAWRYQDGSNYYGLSIQDSASGGTPNTLHVYKVSGNVRSLVSGIASIAFLRGTPHRVRVKMAGSSITVWFDGTPVITTTDTTIASTGLCGLQAEGTPLRATLLRIAPITADVSAQSVYSRFRLTSTDPTATPQVHDATMLVTSPDIEPGTVVPQATYTSEYAAKVLDDLKQKSNMAWTVSPDLYLLFRSRQNVPAPWLLSIPQDLQIFDADVIEQSGDLYSNRQIITGVTDTVAFTDTQRGDGQRRTFTLPYPLAAVPSVKLNGQPVTLGIKGLDTGKDFYWSAGDPVLAQDKDGPLLFDIDILETSALGTYTTTVVRDNVAAQAQLAALSGGSGIVEHVTDGAALGLNIATAQAYGDQLNARYSSLASGRTVRFWTTRPGLAVGQAIMAYIPAAGMYDVPLLITSVEVSVRMVSPRQNLAPRYVLRALGSTLVYHDGLGSGPTPRYVYQVEATENANLGSWQRIVASVRTS